MSDDLNFVVLDTAVGTIQASDAQREHLDELTSRLANGEFHVPVTGTIPRVCIDGRLGGQIGPCAAGGTFSLTVADDLTTQRFSRGVTLARADQVILQTIIAKGEQVGGHSGHADNSNCGCGAKDKVAAVYQYIIENPNVIRRQVESQGIAVSDDVHALIVANAGVRTDFSTGAELSTTLKTVAGDDAESILQGAHMEVVAAINSRDGYSLDRQAVDAAFGPDYQAFNIDVWSFGNGAHSISASDDEAAMKAVAMAYYNFAVANVLCGPGMRVVSVSA